MHNATVSGASGVTAFGIGHNAIVDNKGGSAVTATVTLPATVAGANAYVLTAPSLTSKAITIGGSGVAADGSFHPVAQPLPVSGGTHVTVTVPAGSAVLIATS